MIYFMLSLFLVQYPFNSFPTKWILQSVNISVNNVLLQLPGYWMPAGSHHYSLRQPEPMLFVFWNHAWYISFNYIKFLYIYHSYILFSSTYTEESISLAIRTACVASQAAKSSPEQGALTEATKWRICLSS